MSVIANRVKVAVDGTPGTGTINLGSAIAGYQSFADGGITNGQVVSYAIEDGDAWEIGTGTYTTGTPNTLSRTVIESSNSDAALDLSSNAVVFITALSGDLQNAVDMDQGVATTDSPAFAGITATTADINGGTIDGTVIGGSTPAAISGTTVTSTNTSDGTLSIPTTYVTNGSAKAWVNFNGTATVAARDSLNVSSLTDNGTGDYTVNFTANFSNINYSTVVSYSQDYGVARCVGAQLYLDGSAGTEVAPTAAQARFVTTSALAGYDAKYVCVSNHGNLA